MKSFLKDDKNRKIIMAFWVTLIVAIIAFFIMFMNFSRRLKSTADIGLLTGNTVNVVLPNDNTTSASTSEDKDINSVANSVLNKIENETQAITQNVTAKEEVVSNQISQNENKDNTKTTSNNSTNNSSEASTNNDVESQETSKKEENNVEEETNQSLEFIAPVSGEIITDYADETLIYSNTLEEWTTHLGIDIKADKASTVVASEQGTVKSIKNDPRYGLTITISHLDGYETVYSNLLSSEFVSEGDTVKKGQTIGTVGESASFEVSDVPHLHFEMYKDGNVLNPTTCLK